MSSGVRVMPDEVVAAAEAINGRFADQVYNLWFDWVSWAIPASDPGPRPSDAGAPPRTAATWPKTASRLRVGTVNLRQVWVDDADG